MIGFVFSPTANMALDSIWAYSEEKWGQAQAEAYIQGMMAYLQCLSEKQKPWRKLPRKLIVSIDLDVEVFMGRFEKHILFFRALPSGKLGVLAILHEKMDMPTRLAEDLRKLNKDT